MNTLIGVKKGNMFEREKKKKKRTFHSLKMDNFNEAVFRAKVDSALATVRTILDTTKYPQRPLEGLKSFSIFLNLSFHISTNKQFSNPIYLFKLCFLLIIFIHLFDFFHFFPIYYLKFFS